MIICRDSDYMLINISPASLLVELSVITGNEKILFHLLWSSIIADKETIFFKLSPIKGEKEFLGVFS